MRRSTTLQGPVAEARRSSATLASNLPQAGAKLHPPDDVYEQEANRIADRMVSAAGAASGSPEGDSLPDHFGRMLGVDFGSIRIHHDNEAARAANAISAKAFTVGKDVWFGEGRYSPHTAQGRRLLAHELVHVAQQGAAGRAANAALPLHATPPGAIQRDIAEDRLATTPVEQITADEKWFENGVVNVAYFTGELAVLTYDDGTEIRVGLVPEWIEAPFEAVDFKTLRHEHIPISATAPSLGTGAIRFLPRGAELRDIPRGASFSDVINSDALTRTIRFTHHNGRIVPTEVNTLSAPRLCTALRNAEAEYIRRTAVVAETAVEALEALEVVVTIRGFIQPGSAPGRVRPSPGGAAVGATLRSAAAAESTLVTIFKSLLRSGGARTITVEGVGFGSVRASLQGTELVVARTTIVNASRVPAQGRFIQAAFERAAITAARQVGARTARVSLELVQNPRWAAYLESQGYTFQVIANQSEGFTRVLTKVWTL